MLTSYFLSPTFKSHLENIYFVCAPIVAVAAIYGLRQLKLFKKDMRLRNERAAKELAIEYSLRYLGRYVDLEGVVMDALVKDSLPLRYSGTIGDFSRASLPSPLGEEMFKRCFVEGHLPALNELLVIAAAFTSGVADEQTGFSIIGRTFCGTVKSQYDVLSSRRDAVTHDYYEQIITLYRLWSPRLSRAELEEESKRISKRISSQPIRSIPPIGCE